MTPCPSCSAPLTGAPTCPSCALPLTGPTAARLWQVDQALAELAGRSRELLREREALLARLRGAGPVAATTTLSTAAQERPEATRRSVQNILLALGALLLGGAATVFAAVTYSALGAGGRLLVLLVLTAVAVSAVPVLLRRGLRASAETATAVALVLGVLDAYAVRRLGLGDDLDTETYAGIAAAVLAAAAALGAGAVGGRVAAAGAVALAHLSVLLLLVGNEAEGTAACFVLVALAGADLLLLQAPVLPAARTTALGCGLGTGLLALSAGLAGAEQSDPLAAAGLLLLAGTCVAAAAQASAPLHRLGLSGVAVPIVALAAWTPLHPHLTGTQEPLVASAVAVAAGLLATRLPRAWRPGPVAGALGLAALGLAASAQEVVRGLALPFSWLAAPWTPHADGARAALSPYLAWTGTPVVVLAVAAAAATVGLVGYALHRRAALAVGGLLAVAAVALVPVGLDLPYGVGLAVLLLLGAALAAGSHRLPALLPLAAGVTALACAWATADRTATLVVLPLAAGLAAGRSVLGSARRETTAAAGLLAAGWVGALGAAYGLATDQVGALLVAVVAALVALPLDDVRRTGAEVAAGAGALAALALASGDVGWLSWTCAGLGLVALGGALRADRRLLAPAGALLLAASSWLRLADAGVSAPEPYVVPLGLLALGLGHLRRRSAPATGSLQAYGPGLSALLLPSLLAALRGHDLTRPLLLGLAALAVLLVGVVSRLRAPLALGGGVLAVDALHLLLPYAAALPRWMPLALAGALLLALGATYEQRRRDLHSLRTRYASLA